MQPYSDVGRRLRSFTICTRPGHMRTQAVRVVVVGDGVYALATTIALLDQGFLRVHAIIYASRASDFSLAALTHLQSQILRRGGSVEEIKEQIKLEDLGDCDLLINCAGVKVDKLLSDIIALPVREGDLLDLPSAVSRFLLDVDRNGTQTVVLQKPNTTSSSQTASHSQLPEPSTSLNGICTRSYALPPTMACRRTLSSHGVMPPKNFYRVQRAVMEATTPHGLLVVLDCPVQSALEQDSVLNRLNRRDMPHIITQSRL